MKKSSVAEINSYLQRLFPLNRSLAGEPNRQTLKILQEIVPLKIFEIPSGTKAYDWVVPKEWSANDAWIEDSSGQKIVELKNHNLHLVSYSSPIHRKMSWANLRPHIHRHPSLPNAIPYRTSYYKKNWGFCVTHAQYRRLVRSKGPFLVNVDTQLRRGSLSYGQILIPGRSSREILISTYFCHPSMANDNLSGVILTALLARHLMNLPNRRWSYRIVFVPETIGAIAYCSRNEKKLKAIDIGLVISNVGGPGLMGYKTSWQKDHWINEFTKNTLKKTKKNFRNYPFDIHGSDERQYSSLGFRINCVSITKDKYYEYPSYHSSLDDLAFVKGKNIKKTLKVYQDLIKKIESLEIYQNRFQNCEVMLSRRNLYPSLGGGQKPAKARGWLEQILWILFLADGKKPVQAVAQAIGLKFGKTRNLIKWMSQKGLLSHV